MVLLLRFLVRGNDRYDAFAAAAGDADRRPRECGTASTRMDPGP